MERSVDIYVHEEDMARMERANTRSHFLIIVLIISLLATNIAWVVYEKQFADISTTIQAEQDGAGTNMISGGNLTYGSESENDN